MSAPTRLCDTHDMVVVHRVFRREFALLPTLVSAVPPGDTDRADVVATHATEMLEALHDHHTGEDELLWPRLNQRATLDSELIERMESQHQQIATILDQVHALLPQWRGAAEFETGRRLAALLTAASAALQEHLGEEEAHVLPIVEQHITATEWEQLGTRAIAAMSKARLMVFLGYILEEATPDERRLFMRKLPPPGRVAYRLVGQRKYQQEVARIRSGGPA